MPIILPEPLILTPDILTQPHVPKPLHGVNPRIIKGQHWWDKKREEVYKSTDYHCIACGVPKRLAKYHRWLEAHEAYTIDYNKGLVIIDKIVPLCFSCHKFIHSGSMLIEYRKDKIHKSQVIDILKHGLAILKENNLRGFSFTIGIAESFNIATTVKPECPANSGVKWADWKMVFEGKEYPARFKSFGEWNECYNARYHGKGWY